MTKKALNWKIILIILFFILAISSSQYSLCMQLTTALQEDKEHRFGFNQFSVLIQKHPPSYAALGNLHELVWRLKSAPIELKTVR